KQALNEAFGTENKNGEKEVDFKVDEIQFVPQTTTEISGDDIATFETFLDMLNDLDDVQNVYHSAEF
ncbi:YebC/PmpR family DNA-binding transcriptional regulator, partial [Oleiphilus sp. HI0043]|uniref:YebC/PmpR family DNA-binding transcriptional regulator n=2 Tax=Oleiphilus TaxID=141450 RepID=UPI000A88FA3C